MRKVSLMIAALALVLGISQCKKQEKPVANGQKQHIELTANNGNGGSKVSGSISGADFDLRWVEDDKITVSGGATSDEPLELSSGAGYTSATFRGDITKVSDEDIVFTVGSFDYMLQGGTAEWIGKNVKLEGKSEFKEDGKYSVDMKLPYAVLKLNVSALGTTGELEIKVGGTKVASVTNVTVPTAVFVAVLTDGSEKEYKISIGGKTATKKWSLQPNTFYTKSDGEGGGTGDAFVIEPDAPVVPDGALSGIFTVNSSGLKVYFSRGNLQYLANNGSGTFPGQAIDNAAAGKSVGGTWRFALNQYESQGTNNIYSAYNYTKLIDMFGWGSSGYNHNNGLAGYRPFSRHGSSHGTEYFIYDQTSNSYDLNSSNGKADWGYNKISNGGNAENSGWRTLSQTEWNYLVKERKINNATDFGNTCQRVSYEGKTGLIIYPDNYSGTMYANGAALTSSTFPDGCVFLPYCGYRSTTSAVSDPKLGYYWSSTHSDQTHAYCFKAGSSSFSTTVSQDRGQAVNVRLVRDVPAAN